MDDPDEPVPYELTEKAIRFLLDEIESYKLPRAYVRELLGVESDGV